MSDAAALVGFDTHRDDAGFRFELLDPAGTTKGWIARPEGGGLDFSSSSRTKAGGSLDVAKINLIDWNAVRVRPWARVGEQSWPLGLFVPAAPKRTWATGAWSGSVELLGRLTVIDTDFLTSSVSYPAGTVVTTAIAEQIAAAGQTGTAITASSKTLAVDMTWTAGTSRLTVINELASAIDYRSLYTDGYGRFVVAPYVRPASRPVRYPLLDGPNSIYEDEFERDQDIYSIPNRYVLRGTSAGGAEGLIGLAENHNPASPYSIENRGYVKTETESGVDAADQATIDALARRRLIEASSTTARMPLRHGLIPLDPDDVVRLRRVPAGIDARHVIVDTHVDFTGNGTELAESTLEEVQDL